MKYEFVYQLLKEGEEEFVDFATFPEIVCAIEREDHASGQVPTIAYDAVRNAVQARMDYDDVVPEGDMFEELNVGNVVRLSTLDTMKIGLYNEYLKSGESKAAFAKMVKATPTTLSRVFDLSHSSRFEVLADMFTRLGLELSTDIDPKAPMYSTDGRQTAET